MHYDAHNDDAHGFESQKTHKCTDTRGFREENLANAACQHLM